MKRTLVLFFLMFQGLVVNVGADDQLGTAYIQNNSVYEVVFAQHFYDKAESLVLNPYVIKLNTTLSRPPKITKTPYIVHRFNSDGKQRDDTEYEIKTEYSPLTFRKRADASYVLEFKTGKGLQEIVLGKSNADATLLARLETEVRKESSIFTYSGIFKYAGGGARVVGTDIPANATDRFTLTCTSYFYTSDKSGSPYCTVTLDGISPRTFALTIRYIGFNKSFVGLPWGDAFTLSKEEVDQKIEISRYQIKK